ncbi:MAG: bacterial Ig-like domain-containing protein [Treponema sp.]|jgi:hypothetical protein|nr:bacterial Ig-like domain-containing protein [Treponema sp.]
MAFRGIAFSIIATIIAAALASFGSCDADSATFVFDRGASDLVLDQVVSLQVFPVRQGYLLGDEIAKTEDHLRVFAVYYNGNTREIPLDNTIVTLQDGEYPPITLTEVAHTFITPGEKTVTVRYGDREAKCTILVLSNAPVLTPGPSPEGGTSIEIIWPD